MIYYHPPVNLDPGPGRKLTPDLQAIMDNGPVFKIVLESCKTIERLWTPIGFKCDSMIVKATKGFLWSRCDLGALVTTLWSNHKTDWPKGLTAKERQGLLFFRAICDYGDTALKGNTRNKESEENLLEAMRKLYKLAFEPVIQTAARSYLKVEIEASKRIAEHCPEIYGSSCSSKESKGAFRKDLRLGIHLRRLFGVNPFTVKALYEFQELIKTWD